MPSQNNTMETAVIEMVNELLSKGRIRALTGIATKVVNTQLSMIEGDGSLSQSQYEDIVNPLMIQYWQTITRIFHNTPVKILTAYDKKGDAPSPYGEVRPISKNQTEKWGITPTGFKNYRRYADPVKGWMAAVSDWQLFNKKRDCNRQKFIDVQIPVYSVHSLVEIYGLMVGFPDNLTDEQKLVHIGGNRQAMVTAFCDWFIVNIRSVLEHEFTHYWQKYQSNDKGSKRENRRLLFLFWGQEPGFTRRELVTEPADCSIPYEEQNVEHSAFAQGASVFFRYMAPVQALKLALEQVKRVDLKYMTLDGRKYFIKRLSRVIDADNVKVLVDSAMA